MMKRIPFISRYSQGALAASLALLLAACGSSEEYKWEMWDQSQQDEMPVSVITQDGKVEDLKSGSTLGIFVINDDGTVTWMNVTVDKDGNIILPPEAMTGKVVAYSPAQPGWGESAFASPQQFDIQADQSEQADYDASDLMIGTASVVTRAAEMELQLRHMLAKVMIHIIDETGSLDGQSINIRLLRMAGSVTVNLAGMSVSTRENSLLDIDMLPYNLTDRRITMAAIVAPQTKQAGDDLFEFSMAGSHRKCTLATTTELEGGQTFVYQMRYTEEGLVPDGSYITNWETDDSVTEFDIRVKK